MVSRGAKRACLHWTWRRLGRNGQRDGTRQPAQPIRRLRDGGTQNDHSGDSANSHATEPPKAPNGGSGGTARGSFSVTGGWLPGVR